MVSMAPSAGGGAQEKWRRVRRPLIAIMQGASQMPIYEIEEVNRLARVQSILNGMGDQGVYLASELSILISSISRHEDCDAEHVLDLMNKVVKYLAGKSND